MPRVTVNGTELYYEIRGAGPSVLLIMGATGDGGHFDALGDVLAGEFTGKTSTPYGVGTVHDFMHAKIVVADDVVFSGSFNLSRSGEQNAENVLEIHDPALAEHLSAYADEVRRRYPPVQLPA